MIDVVTRPDSGQSLLLRGENPELSTASLQDLKSLLSGRLGELLTVRLVEVLSPEKLLLEVAGTEVVAKGLAPAGSAALFTVRLESVEPVVRLSLVDQGESYLPLRLRRIMGEVVAKPNLFSKDIMFLKELLQDPSASLSTSLRNDLTVLTARFSASSFLVGLRSGEGFPLAQLGLFHEQKLVQLLASEPEKISRSRMPGSLATKEMLLRFLVALEGEFPEEIVQGSGSEPKMIAKLHSVLRSMLDLVELNQCLNNSGLRNEEGFVLMIPLWGWGEAADLWLRLSRDGEPESGSGSSCTLMIYLDLEGLGPVGVQIVAGAIGLQAKLMVVGEDSAQSLRELLPEARRQLRSRFSGGVRLVVESIGPKGVEKFRQRAFLASLPPLFTAAG